MTTNDQPKGTGARPSRKTLRLTFRVANGEARLVKLERLNMICPPSIGQAPQVGTHGGFWVEVRDAGDNVLFHRVLHVPLQDSVEVHSPDGKVKRVEGVPTESVFEVLVPDNGDASNVALIGEYLDPAKKEEERTARMSADSGRAGQPTGAYELARFEIPKADGDGDPSRGGA